MATTLDKNGNVIENGYSTNLSPTQYSTISADSLKTQTPVTIPAKTQDTTDYNSQYVAPVQATIANDLAAREKAVTTQENITQSSGNDYLGIMEALRGRTADLQQAQEQAGVNTETANLNKYAEQLANLNAQASSLNREAQAIPIQLQQESQGRGRTEAGVAPLQAARLRENALKALSIGQQADIAAAAATGSQLRLNAAKEKAQQAVDLKYKPLEEQLAIKKQIYEMNKEQLASLDKKRAEALNIAIRKEERDLEEKKANEKAVSDLIVNASSQNAPQDILNKAKNAKTPAEAAMILGQYAGNYWAIEKAKQDALKAREVRLTTPSGIDLTGDVKAQISNLSKEAQSYINSIQRGETTRDAVFTKLGATKAALALKNEISVGLDLIAGGKTGSKIINSTEAANFQSLLETMDNIDITAYGQFDTPGGLIFDIRNPTTAAYIDQIVASLSLEKRELLKGSGAISDFESRTLANAATILGRKNISEKAAKEALDGIRTIFENKVSTYNEQTGAGSENDPNSPWNRARQSQESGLSNMGQKGYIDPNAPFGEIRFNLPTSTPIK